MLPKLSDTTQTISFSEADDVCSADVFANNVVVTTTAGNHNHGSSKVKLKSLVDYNWEPKFYSGQLLATHMTGKYLAYSIKAPNTMISGTWTGMVRVVYRVPGSDKRVLIKGMHGEVHDLAFAHIENQVILASIDEQGNFYVHEIQSTEGGLRCMLLVEVREDTGVASSSHRVLWCPYIPDDDEDGPDDDVAKLLLTTHSNIARMWNVRSLASSSTSGAISVSSGGAVALQEHTAPLVDAAFSPDGTALATASADGYVMFFQVYMQDNSSPRCLHKWQPHGGKALSSLFFLDNHKNYNTDVQFWKFAVTGAENNTTLKIWSCQSWSCLQTLTFVTSATTDQAFGLKALLDTSATYLVLSDFKTRNMYVLNMARDKDDSTAYCKTVHEFLLPYPVLSFCIADVGEADPKSDSACNEPYDRNGSSGENDHSPDEFEVANEDDEVCGGTAGAGGRVSVTLCIVQPKGLQEGRLTFYQHDTENRDGLVTELEELTLDETEPEPNAGNMSSSILLQQSEQLKNLLLRSRTQPGALLARGAESPPPLTLMTPDAFSSPGGAGGGGQGGDKGGKRDEDDPPLEGTTDVAKQRNSTSGYVCSGVGAVGVSGGSSPSREVRDILSHDTVVVAPLTGFLHEEVSPIPPTAPPVPTPPAVPSSTDTTWPQISLAAINEANQRKASSDKSTGSLNTSLNVDEDRSAAHDPRISVLENKLDKLIELTSQQGRELRELRSLRAERELLDQYMARTTTAIEAALSDGVGRLSSVGEACGSRAAAAAGVGAARALDPLVTALTSQVATKLTATDHLLRENIHKLVNSKTVMEGLSTSIATSLADMVRSSFKEAMAATVIPAMEKGHAQIFRQINNAFTNGTKEFVAQTESLSRVAAERGATGAVTSLRAALERHGAVLAGLPPPQSPHAVATAVRDVVHQVMEKELESWREVARSELSRVHSPAPSVNTAIDRQMQVAQIQSLMNNGDVNGAFQVALSASDLSLVTAACRAADPAVVPSRLKQNVLLSLVQQLAADMTHDTQLKHRYLEEAIIHLDTSDPVTRGHLPMVISEVKAHIVSFLGSNPGHVLTRQFRMLLMAADSLLKNNA